MLYGTASGSVRNITLTGKQTSREITVKPFTAIHASSGVDVHFNVGALRPASVETDEALMPYVEVSVRGGVLYIGYSDNIVTHGPRKTIVRISAPSVTGFTASSSADIHITNKITAPKVSFTASSSGDITGEVECSELSVTASSSGKVKFRGQAAKGTLTAASSAKIESHAFKCRTLNVSARSSADIDLKGSADIATVTASSSAEVDMEEMECGRATVTASSSADVDIKATAYLKANASSNAEIGYYGSPQDVSAAKSSGGKIKAKE